MTSVSPRLVNRVAEAVEGVCVKNVAALQTRDRRNGSIHILNIGDGSLLLDYCPGSDLGVCYCCCAENADREFQRMKMPPHMIVSHRAEAARSSSNRPA